MFFEYPRLLWLELLPFLLILHYVYLEWRKRAPHLRVSTIVPWRKSGKSVYGILRHLPFLMRILALVMIIIAIARPRSAGEIERVDSEGIDIMLTMDVSTSMLARDFTPDRLSAAKDIAIEFIAQRPYDRIGIVVFAGESFTQCPMTTDRSTLINLMKEVQTDLIEDGTAIGNGLATAVARMKDSDAKSRVVILLTDGVNNAGEISPQMAAQIAKTYGVRVYTIGVGARGMAPYPVMTPWGVDIQKVQVEIDEDLLKETEKMKNSVAKNSAAVELLISLFIIASFAVGVLLVSEGTLSLGRMIIGVTAVFGSFGPVTALSALPGNLTQTFACGDRVLNLLEEQPAVQPVIGGKTFRFDRVNVDRLSFAYNDEAEILKEICLNAKKGEIIGIVGKSGCGKSTLLKLLMRFREKNSGRIDYNETEIGEIDSVNLTDNVTMVPQNVWLFDETVEENLRIAKPEATAEELEAACRAAAIHERIVSLPDGFRTRVGFGGSRLSAGEKQRLGVARAFLRGSGLILLDEPTGNIDSLNEGILLKSLVNAKKDKCIILVSHRESTMSIADRIYRLENHRLHEGGENG